MLSVLDWMIRCADGVMRVLKSFDSMMTEDGEMSRVQSTGSISSLQSYGTAGCSIGGCYGRKPGMKLMTVARILAGINR